MADFIRIFSFFSSCIGSESATKFLHFSWILCFFRIPNFSSQGHSDILHSSSSGGRFISPARPPLIISSIFLLLSHLFSFRPCLSLLFAFRTPLPPADGARGLGVTISRRRRNPHTCVTCGEHPIAKFCHVLKVESGNVPVESNYHKETGL